MCVWKSDIEAARLRKSYIKLIKNSECGREKGQVVFRPENKAYPVIRPKGAAEIFGVVVGLFRKY